MATQDKLTRIAIVSNDKCKPKRCKQECKRSCPVVRMGMCVLWSSQYLWWFISGWSLIRESFWNISSSVCEVRWSSSKMEVVCLNFILCILVCCVVIEQLGNVCETGKLSLNLCKLKSLNFCFPCENPKTRLKDYLNCKWYFLYIEHLNIFNWVECNILYEGTVWLVFSVLCWKCCKIQIIQLILNDRQPC